MALYFVRSILCMAVLLLVYLLFLEKEKMHRFNRLYLLISIIFALLVPLISISVTSADPGNIVNTPYVDVVTNMLIPVIHTTPQNIVTTTPIDVTRILLIAYCLVTLILLIRFTRNIYALLSRATKNDVIEYHGAKLVLLPEEVASHSFLSYIFISRTDYEKHIIEEEIFTHELTHIKERHSWDVLFIQLLQAVCWINPLLPFYKKAIQLNHEFLADDAVVTSSKNITGYQELLLTKAAMISKYKLSSAFNYSVTKKRLLMMATTVDRTSTIIKQIALIPVFAASILLFATKSIIAQNIPPKISTGNTAKSPVSGNRDLLFPYNLIKETPFTKEGVSDKVYADYKATEQKYITVNKNPSEELDFNSISDAERSRLEAIFKKMSREQQRKCQLFFTPPMGPIKAEPPMAEQLKRWSNRNIYRVLIHDKIVTTEEFEQYKASDFASAIVDTRKSPDKQNDGKYTYQVSLIDWASHNEMNIRLKAEKRFNMGYISRNSRIVPAKKL